MSQETIIVPKREEVSKTANRTLRRQGFIPAVVYGLQEPPVPIAISPKVVARILASEAGANSVLYLQREGTDIKRHAIIKEVQRHPVTGRLQHVDFLRVDMTHKIRVRVPIHLTGTAIGVKSESGMLDFVHREVEVECLPNLIPSHITVDVTELNLGQSIRFDQIPMDPNITIVGDAHQVVCAVHVKAAEEELAPTTATPEAAAAEAAAPAEPELVITKGKKDKEEKAEKK